MVVSIGTEVLLDGTKIVYVQDRDLIRGEAKVGVPDTNTIIWDAHWVCFSRLTESKRGVK